MNSSLLAEYRADVWAMEPRALEAFLGHLADLCASEPVAAGLFEPDPGFKSRMTVAGGVAEIPVVGALLKRVPAIFRRWGIEATGYSEIAADVREALADKSVKVIRLRVESPGGQVAGVTEAGDAIYAARLEKTVHARIEDIGASGAYWLAAQANTISADRNAMVGSIGVYSVVEDSSRAAEMEGVKVHVLSSGEHKGMGIPGAPVTDKQLEGMRAVINGMADNFIVAVAGGREVAMDKAVGWATGQVWLADTARQMGLIDRVEGLEDMKGSPGVPAAALVEHEENAMSKSETLPAAPAPAAAVPAPDPMVAERKRQDDLCAAFPGEPQFVLDQIAAGASVTDAKAAFADVLKGRNADLAKENAELKAKAAAPAPAPVQAPVVVPAAAGAPPVPQAGEPGNAAEKDFMAASKDYAKEHKCSITTAMSAVAKAEPALHEQFRLKQVARGPEVRERKRALGMK